MTTISPSIESALRQLIHAVVAEVVPQVIANQVAEPRYATAKTNPIGSRRAFLDAARKGAFPSYTVGREIRALWSDVDTYIRSLPRRSRGSQGVDVDALYRHAMNSRKGTRRGR